MSYVSTAQTKEAASKMGGIAEMGCNAFVTRKPVHMTAPSPPPTNVEEEERRMWQPSIPVKVKRRRRRRGGASKLWLRASEQREEGGEREAAHNVLTYV